MPIMSLAAPIRANEDRKMVEAYTTDKAMISNMRRIGASQPCLRFSERDLLAYPMMNEMTPHAATMPEHTMKRRWVSCQMAGANCRYRFMDTAPTTAQIRKEMRPEVSAHW